SAEALVFASVYERYESLIEQDGLVLLTGKVSTQENKEPNIVSERVISLSDARKKLTRNVCMNLSLDDLDNEKLKSVEKLVSSHDGKCEFLIHLINGGKKEYVVRSKKYKVSPDAELLLGLKEIVGEENVWIEGE
ncbi:MAG: hypothetical protein V3U73_07485, partial [bacterium]